MTADEQNRPMTESLTRQELISCQVQQPFARPFSKENVKMKKNAHPLVLLLVLGLTLTCRTPAQTFRALHSFAATTQTAVNFTNSD